MSNNVTILGDKLRLPARLGSVDKLAQMPVPPSLFADDAAGRGRVAFVDIEGLSMAPLLRAVAMNSVKTVIDLRPEAIFRRPEFRHKEVVSYFYRKNIEYVECAMIDVRARERPESGGGGGLVPSLGSYLSRGLTLCIFDAEAREIGWLDNFRRQLAETPGFSVEIHPRSLPGIRRQARASVSR